MNKNTKDQEVFSAKLKHPLLFIAGATALLFMLQGLFNVNIDRTSKVSAGSQHDLSGYAWSDNIGWISFNENNGCPEAGCVTKPKMDKNSGAVTGWAKALSADSNGWDGWIKLGGAWSPSLSFTGVSASGYSWGSDVVGWVSWSGSGYGVVSSVDLTNQPPTVVSISSPAIDISVYTVDSVYFDGTGNDPDGTVAGYQWRSGGCSTGAILSNSQSFSQTFSEGTYTVYFRVQDNKGAWSTDCPSRNVTVTYHPPVPGVCGSANGNSTGVKPTSNLCDVGPASTVTPESGAGPWSWTCAGQYSGATASCGAATTCGNGTCEPGKHENPTTCRLDCPIRVQEF